jgi:hypothetical protein
MSTVELAKMLGKEADLYTAEGLRVKVRIEDAKVAYGSTRVRVTPVNGVGFAWVDRSRVTLEKEAV